jgi:hypothetical protein
MKQLLAILLISILFSGCDDIAEYYVGLKTQPDISKEDILPGLNVYGILKTGPTLDTLNHYFEVQQILFIWDSFDSICVDRANVVLTRKPFRGESEQYTLNCERDCAYFNENIKTAPGDNWQYVCSYDTFEVTASCVIPNEPKVSKLLVDNGSNTIGFSVLSDSSAFMYDIYILSAEDYYTEKKIPTKGVDTEFSINLHWNVAGKTIMMLVFAYDENLEKYYTTSNTFFKPNAYRPYFSTVDGGFGTFGAVSSSYLQIVN